MIIRFMRQWAILLLFLFAAGIAVPVFSQSERSGTETSWKINPAADILYTLFDINTSNLFLNDRSRLDELIAEPPGL